MHIFFYHASRPSLHAYLTPANLMERLEMLLPEESLHLQMVDVNSLLLFRISVTGCWQSIWNCDLPPKVKDFRWRCLTSFITCEVLLDWKGIHVALMGDSVALGIDSSPLYGFHVRQDAGFVAEGAT
ncbi:hypothetical protein GOBAR_DD19099 [Gossypium barbadense]|nr:hypothetical protein GOBAR_DD19099 [Gossypium barbadense]